jgi:sugar lactone lactonase YvrE
MKLLISWLTPLIALLAYLVFWPVPVQPVSWQAPSDKGHSGPHAVNTKLAGLQTWPLKDGQEGPEHITSHAGQVYTALGNGDVIRVNPDGQQELVVNTGGRPLGLEATADGTLYIADAMKGLLAVNLAGGPAELRSVLTSVNHPLPEDRIRYADAVSIDPRGNVWLTDASRAFGAKDIGSTFEASVLDIMEGSCTGRVIVLEPATGKHRVAIHGLCFPNGMAFSADGKSMFLSETGRYRILKIDLAALSLVRATQGLGNVPSLKDAMTQGAARVLIDNLPGFPDNIT